MGGPLDLSVHVMPSPFPGMDPYLESSGHWPDFHSKLINVCQELILEGLPLSYDARVQEDIRLTDTAAKGPDASRTYVPDVHVSHDPKRQSAASRNSGAVATIEPVTLRTPVYREVRDEWIEIVTQPDRELVTVVEILSPSNKYNPGFAQHQEKRASFVHNGIHVVDIDLLTAGRRPVLEPELPASDYAVLVFRADGKEQCDAYLWNVRRPLPKVPIPLRDEDKPVELDLATAFATTYSRGQYGRTIRYDRELNVRLWREDLLWANDLAKKAAPVG